MGESHRAKLGLGRWAGLLVFAYILARPVSTNSILVPMLAAMGALAAAAIVFARRPIASPLLPALIITLVFGLSGLAINPANPGFTGSLLVFVVAPLLYWMVSVSADERLLRGAFAATAWVTIFLGVTVSLYVAGAQGSFPQIIPEWLLQQNGAYLGMSSDTYTQIRYYGISTLVATGPMWAASLFVGNDKLLPARWLRVLAVLAALVGTLVVGRRGLALVMTLAPVLLWVIKLVVARGRRIVKVDLSWLVFGGLGLAGIVAIFPNLLSGQVITSTWRSVIGYVTGSGFSGSNAGDDQVRSYEASRLLQEWSNSPIFGHGLGATIQGYSRSASQPWRWELQYHALLFQTGIFGALLILAGIVMTVNAVIKAARHRPDLSPALVVACTGCAAMLIANATNPYLQAPGNVWSIFLPVALANMILVGKPAGPTPNSRPRLGRRETVPQAGTAAHERRSTKSNS